MELGKHTENLNYSFENYSLLPEEDLLPHLDGLPHSLQDYVDTLDRKWSPISENLSARVCHLDPCQMEDFYEN